MSPSTDSPTFTEISPDSANAVAAEAGDGAPLGADATDATDAAARAFPGRVRGQRLEITHADLTMYSAITGRAPSREERQRALTWSEADPMHGRIAGAAGPSSTTPPSTAVLPMHALRPWHPSALSLRVREIWFNGLTLRVNRPQISAWVRRLSLALQQGRRRVRHAR